MKLLYAPGTSSMGIHILLEEIGKPYELSKLDIRNGEHLRPPFSELDSKDKVSTLQRDDGSIVTEFPAIAHHLTKTNPDAGLLPMSAEAELRAVEVMNDCVATIHIQAFMRQIRPGNVSKNEAEHDAVKAQGREMAAKGFDPTDKALAGKDWVAGSDSTVDSALFHVAFCGRRMGIARPPNVAAHLDRMLARPAMQRMIDQEGLTT